MSARIALLLFVFGHGLAQAAASPETAAKRLRIFTARGWSLSISFSEGAFEQAMKDDPERLQIVRTHYEFVYFSNGHYLLPAPSALRKDQLPEPGSSPIPGEETEVVEGVHSILWVKSKTPYPLLDKIIRRSQDRADADSYDPGARRKKARRETLRTADGADLESLAVETLPLGGRWIENFAAVYDLRVDGEPVEVVIIGKPSGGFSRVKPALAERLRAVAEPTLLVNLGDIALGEEFGVEQDALLESMIDSGFRLLAFSGGDMEFVWDSLLKSARFGPPEKRVVLLASNLTSTDHAVASILQRAYTETVDGIKIGFFSLVEPSAAAIAFRKHLPVTVTDPLAAAREVVQDLRAREKVDLVVALSHLTNEENAALTNDVPGIDLLLGGELNERRNRRHTIVDLTDWSQEMHRQPALTAAPSQYSYDEIVLDFRPGAAGRELTRIEEIPGPLGPYLPMDQNVAEIESKAFLYFETGKDPLLPDPRSLWPNAKKPKLTLEPLEFWNLAAEAARRRTGAEIALLRIRRLNNNTGGEVTESFVKTWVDAKERLVRLKLTGQALRSLISRIVYEEFPILEAGDKKFNHEIWLAQAGLSAKSLVHNLPIYNDESYFIVTTEDVLKQEAALPALKTAADVQVQNLTLDQVVMDWLKQRRNRLENESKQSSDAAANARYAAEIRSMVEGAVPERPVWRLDLRELSGQFSNTQLHNAGPFSQVPDARIQSVSQVQGQGTAKLFSEFYWQHWRWDVGATAQYGEVIIRPPGVPPIENKTQDQLLAETELRYRAFRFERGQKGYSFGPYLNASYDTQFTPTPAAIVPFRKFFWLKPGLKLFEGTSLRELHVAAVAQTDYSKPQTKTEYGFETGYDWISSPFPKSNVTFETKASYIEFAPNRLDTLGDLRRQLEVGAKLHIPILGKLQMSPFIDFYLFDSKLLPARGYNLLFGISIDYSHLWKPIY